MFQRHKLGYDWLLQSEGIKINPHVRLMPPVTWKLNFATLQQYHITTGCCFRARVSNSWHMCQKKPANWFCVSARVSFHSPKCVKILLFKKKRENHVWQGTSLNIQCNISIDFTWHPTDTLEKYGFSITPWLY